MMVWERASEVATGIHSTSRNLSPASPPQQATAAVPRGVAPGSNATPSLRILEMLRTNIRATTSRPTFEPLRFFTRSYVA